MNNEKKELVQFSELESKKLDINQTIEEGKQIISLLKKMGIKEATFDTGTYFKNDKETGSSLIVSDSIAMIKNKHTTSITYINEGSTKEEALEEIKNSAVTQKALGAFTGQSQQNVSKKLINKKIVEKE